MCIDMCIDMCIGLYTGMSLDVSINMCIQIFIDMCTTSAAAFDLSAAKPSGLTFFSKVARLDILLVNMSAAEQLALFSWLTCLHMAVVFAVAD